jgi:hypothetical protein
MDDDDPDKLSQVAVSISEEEETVLKGTVKSAVVVSKPPTTLLRPGSTAESRPGSKT